jgi:hypothetical protein
VHTNISDWHTPFKVVKGNQPPLLRLALRYSTNRVLRRRSPVAPPTHRGFPVASGVKHTTCQRVTGNDTICSRLTCFGGMIIHRATEANKNWFAVGGWLIAWFDLISSILRPACVFRYPQLYRVRPYTTFSLHIDTELVM